jgi:hypothetical protein
MAATLGEDAIAAGAHSCYESCFTPEGRESVLLQRVVIDVEVGPEGRLQPRAGAALRSEPARGEVAIHRRLAGLETAPDARIAGFASIRGFLRRRSLPALSAPSSEAMTTIIGQEAMDDSARAQEWFERGAVGPPPEGTNDTVAAVVLFATMPGELLDAFDAFLGGAAPAPIAPAAFYGLALPVAAATGAAALPYLADAGHIRTIDPSRVRQAFRMNEWACRLAAGLEPVPEVLSAIGGPDDFIRQLTANVPEAYAFPELLDGPDGRATAFMRTITIETVDDWRTAARDMGALVLALDHLRGALATAGMTRAEKTQLAHLYTRLAEYRAPASLTAAEIADRVRPLLKSHIESELESLGVWPVRRGAPAGVYVRALLAAWAELTQVAPPTACATSGCAGVAPATRNRRYCDSCQANRRRETVRLTRSKANLSHRSG